MGGLALRALWWPVEDPRGTVLVVHGLGDHVGRYRAVGDGLAARGWAVWAYDQRGHGRSEGRRGVLRSFELLLGDLDRVRNEAAGSPGAGSPTVLLGHSMGGLVVARYLQTRSPDVAGAVLTAPWLATAMDVPVWKLHAARILRYVAPDLTLATDVDPSVLTRDPEAQRAYEEDPLVHGRMSSRMFEEFQHAQSLARQGSLPCPALLLVPTDDGLADASVTLAWAREMKRSDVTVRTLEGLRHEPFQEPERKAVLEEAVRWMEARREATP